MRDGGNPRGRGWRRSREWRYTLQGASNVRRLRRFWSLSSDVRLTLSWDCYRVEMQPSGIPGNKLSFRSHFVSLANNL